MADPADARPLHVEPPQGAAPARAEQRRSTLTRAGILDAAIVEFGRRGFDAASMRSIAMRSGVPHALITYHFQTKDLLWRSAAERAFARIRSEWDARRSEHASALDRLRQEYGILFGFTVAYPEFHRLMDRETDRGNQRLAWVSEIVVLPLIERLLPQIEEAQRLGDLPPVSPILFHYMMVSLSSTLARFGPEMEITSAMSPDDPGTTTEFWSMVETFVFRNDARPGQVGGRSGGRRIEGPSSPGRGGAATREERQP